MLVVLVYPEAVSVAAYQMEGSSALADWMVIEDASYYLDSESGLTYCTYNMDHSQSAPVIGEGRARQLSATHIPCLK